jgi:hypothetical protein
MKVKNALIAASLVGAAASASAHPVAGAGSYLDVVARDLTSSAQNLTYVVRLVGANGDAYQDAITLSQAAEHFQEEVELGPEDLDVDFNAIEQTFNELGTHFKGCHEYGVYEQVRTAWFRVEEANVRLRQAYVGGGDDGNHGGGYPGGGYPGGNFPGGGYPGGGQPGGFPDHHGDGDHGWPGRPGGWPGRPGGWGTGR